MPGPAKPTAEILQPQKDRRIAHIMHLMCEAEWYVGRSHADVAKRFRVSVRTIENDASEASRILRVCAGADKEEIRAAIIAGVEKCQRLAAQRKRVGGNGKMYPDPDVKSMLAALELKARVQGVMVDRHDPAQPDEAAEFHGWTAEDLERYASTGESPQLTRGNGKGSNGAEPEAIDTEGEEKPVHSATS